MKFTLTTLASSTWKNRFGYPLEKSTIAPLSPGNKPSDAHVDRKPCHVDERWLKIPLKEKTPAVERDSSLACLIINNDALLSNCDDPHFIEIRFDRFLLFRSSCKSITARRSIACCRSWRRTTTGGSCARTWGRSNFPAYLSSVNAWS